jgi:hypothetical protein
MPMGELMQDESDHARRVVFLKLRKTGGTSLAASILFPYCVKHGLRYMEPMNWFAVHPRVVSGDRFHMMFRHFPDYPQPWAKQWLRQMIGDFRLITIVRDPIERAVSAFNHHARHHGYTSFTYYFENDHEKNHQSRWLGYDGRDDNFFENNLSMVGITERFNESMLLLRRTLDLSLSDMLYVTQRREKSKALDAADMPEKWLNIFKATDWLDFELHAQAKRFVDKRIAGMPDLEAELKQYESALGDLSHPLWDERGRFAIGYAQSGVWSEFTGRGGEVKELRPLGA